MYKKNKYFFWTVSSILIALLWLFQYKITVNIPWWDDFYGIILPVFHLYSNIPISEKIRLFFSLNNEHRVVNDRLFLLLTYIISGRFELKTLAMLGYINLIGIFLLFHKIAKPLVGNLLFLLPVPLLIFHAQYYESLQSLMVPFQNFSVIFYVFLTFYYLIYKKINSLLPAFLFALLAFFSHGNGILAFLIGLVILLINKRTRDFIIWSLMSMVTILMYFWGYEKPEWSSGVSPSSQPIAALRYVFEFYGAYSLNITDLSTTAKTFYSHLVSQMFGLFLVLIFIVLFLRKYPIFSKSSKEAFEKLQHSKSDQFIICVFGFVLATGIMIGISRTGFAMLSRYTINSSFMVIAVYLFLVSNIVHKKFIASVASIITISIVFISYYNNSEIAIFNKKNAITDGINFQKTGTWSNQYIDSLHVAKLNPLLVEPYKAKKYVFPVSVLDQYNMLDSESSNENLNFGIKTGILEISGELPEPIEAGSDENGVYFSLENQELQFIFPAIHQKNNVFKCILSQKYHSEYYRTIYPVKLIPKGEYKLYKIVVKNGKVTKYDLGRKYGPSPIIV